MAYKCGRRIQGDTGAAPIHRCILRPQRGREVRKLLARVAPRAHHLVANFHGVRDILDVVAPRDRVDRIL
eukprot:2472619-Alexandrium_andersonii.AAC.1